MESYAGHHFSSRFDSFSSDGSKLRISCKSRGSQVIGNKQEGIRAEGEVDGVVILEDTLINKKMIVDSNLICLLY